MDLKLKPAVPVDAEPLPPEEILEEMVAAMVFYPQDVYVTIREEGQKIRYLTIHCHKEDRGKVIGKEGRAMEALRTTFNSIGAMNDIFLRVELEGSDFRPRGKKS